MFKMTKTTTTVLPGEEDETVTNTLLVLNHLPLVKLLKDQGLPTNHVADCNYFNYWALPYIPNGKFLVSEKQWIDGGFEVGTFTLTVEDEYSSKSFENCYLKSIYYVQGVPTQGPGDLQATGGQGRLLVVEIELQCDYNQYKVFIPIVKEPDKLYEDGEVVDTGATLLPQLDALPDGYDYAFLGIERPFNYYPAYLAHTHFLTAYIPASGGASRKGIITNDSITQSSILDQTNDTNSLLISKVSINEINFDFKLLVITTEDPVTDMLESAEQTIYGEEDFLYKSSVLSQLEFLTGGKFYYPWTILENAESGGTAQEKIDAIAENLKDNAATRVCIDINLLYLGVISTDPTNDVQRITYSFTSIGLTTRLETDPWRPWNPYCIPNDVGKGGGDKRANAVLDEAMDPEMEYVNVINVVMTSGSAGTIEEPLSVANQLKWYGIEGNQCKIEWNEFFDNGIDPETEEVLPKGRWELYAIEVNYTLECPVIEVEEPV
jgi:hypothetical protein